MRANTWCRAALAATVLAAGCGDPLVALDDVQVVELRFEGAILGGSPGAIGSVDALAVDLVWALDGGWQSAAEVQVVSEVEGEPGDELSFDAEVYGRPPARFVQSEGSASYALASVVLRDGAGALVAQSSDGFALYAPDGVSASGLGQLEAGYHVVHGDGCGGVETLTVASDEVDLLLGSGDGEGAELGACGFACERYLQEAPAPTGDEEVATEAYGVCLQCEAFATEAAQVADPVVQQQLVAALAACQECEALYAEALAETDAAQREEQLADARACLSALPPN